MSAVVSGRTGNWEIVIGMEVHAQVVSNAKLSFPLERKKNSIQYLDI